MWLDGSITSPLWVSRLDQPHCGQCSWVGAGEKGMLGVQMGADVSVCGSL